MSFYAWKVCSILSVSDPLDTFCSSAEWRTDFCCNFINFTQVGLFSKSVRGNKMSLILLKRRIILYAVICFIQFLQDSVSVFGFTFPSLISYLICHEPCYFSSSLNISLGGLLRFGYSGYVSAVVKK